MSLFQIIGITKVNSGKLVYVPRRAALKVAAFVRKRQRITAFTGLLLLCFTATADYFVSGFARRTFVFYLIDTGQNIVEERMLMRTGSDEADIGRYVAEVILGPLSLEAAPLLDHGARLEAVLLRDGAVFLDFSREAAIPPPTGGLADKFEVLNEGIRRNFSFVKDIRIFIAGQEAKFF